MIRKAVIQDVKHIHRLLSHYADRGLLLPRSLSELYDHLRDHFVAQDQGRKDSIVGVSALGVCWEDLAEIRSLAVVKGHQRRGLGTQLVQTCLEEAHSLGLKKVFTLSYVPGFFAKLGFREVEKSVLPHKIWGDCLKCPKFPDCDETAMMIDIETWSTGVMESDVGMGKWEFGISKSKSFLSQFRNPKSQLFHYLNTRLLQYSIFI